MDKKILISLSVIGAVAAIAIGGTIAFFSDTETSTGNTFTAGSLDLTIDSKCTYNGVVLEDCTWQNFRNLSGELFFNFDDIKPGDSGEDTISLHVTNDSWACMNFNVTENKDNGCNDPEKEAEPSCEIDDIGELLQNLKVKVWRDTNCDNVFDENESLIPAEGSVYPIADSQHGTKLLASAEKTCVGVMWNVPYETGNEIQTDSVKADITFYAEQWRNNLGFVCPSMCNVVEGIMGEGWSNTAINHAFALGAKFGDTDYTGDSWVGPELFVQESVAGGNSVIAEEDHEWTDGQWYDFTATYDGLNTASITVNGKTAGITDSDVAIPTEGEIAITVKTADTPWNDEGDKVVVKNLMLNGCLISPDNIEAVHPNTGRTLKYIQLSGLDLSSGFILTGKIMFDWQTPQTRFYRSAFGMNIDVR